MNQEKVEFLRKVYKKGTKVRCRQMEDPYSPVPKDTIGIIEFVDDMGQIHVKWENGSSLALIYGVDLFETIFD